MKNLMVANVTKGRYTKNNVKTLLKAQIENSLDLGWLPDDIIILSNLKMEHKKVKTTTIELNDFCLTGSKMFGLKHLFDHDITDDIVWAHDTDAWQNAWFDCPEFKDVGGSYYSKPKFNGGSIFWKPSARDIVEKIIDIITKDKLAKEEPTLNTIFRSEEYKNRVTVLNNTYNVGCSGYVERYQRSEKPVKVLHFHPYNRIAWETHVLDRNGLGEKGITLRLENVIRKHYTELAIELSEEGKKAQKEKRKKRAEKDGLQPQILQTTP